MIRAGRAAALALASAAVLIAAGPASARPAIVSVSAGLHGVGASGPSYTVRVTGRVRVCAAKGRLVLRIREQKTGFDDPPTLIAENFRKFFTTQNSRCQSHKVQWTLGDRFFGIGVYRLRFQAIDHLSDTSPSIFRSFPTND